MKKIMPFLLILSCVSTVLTKDNESEPISEKGAYKFIGMTCSEREKAIALWASRMRNWLWHRRYFKRISLYY